MVIENHVLKKCRQDAHTDGGVREENGEVNWGQRMVDSMNGGV